MILETAKDNLLSVVDFCYNQDYKKLFSADTQLNKNQLVPLSAAAAVTFIVWKLCKRSSNNSDSSSSVDASLLPPLVKGGVPLLGNLLELEKDPAKFIRKSTDEYGPCFRIQMPGQGQLVVVTGPLISEVMKSTKDFSFNIGIEVLVPASRVVKESYKHKYRVADISPREKHPIVYPIKHNFKENQIHAFSERIQGALKGFLDKELALKPGEERNVTVWETLTLLISSVSCPCFAGSKVGYDPELIVGMANFTQKIIKAGVFLSILPDALGRFVVRNFYSVEHEMDLIMNLLVPELEKIERGEAGDDYELTFPSLALELPKEDGSRRSVEEAAYHFNGIALASIHTTSHFSAFALHELACRPTLCGDLRTEIATLGNDRTPETVAKLPLMDSFFREVLRFNVDFLGMHHLAIRDTTISSGHIIPKGSLIVCAMDQVHRDPRFLPVDEETGEVISGDTPLEVFDAYRTCGKKMKSTTTGLEHLTFGYGIHACPGRYLAANEIKYMVSELLVRYNIRTKSGQRAKDYVLFGMTRFAPLEQLIFEGR